MVAIDSVLIFGVIIQWNSHK